MDVGFIIKTKCIRIMTLLNHGFLLDLDYLPDEISEQNQIQTCDKRASKFNGGYLHYKSTDINFEVK